MVFNIDESPISRNWTKTNWNLPRYRTKAFFAELDRRGMTLTEFKKTVMYRQAKEDGKIDQDDKWVPSSKR